MDYHADATRLERIDRLADRWLRDNPALVDVAATVIWDMAAERIDEQDRRAMERRLDAEYDPVGLALVEDYG
jgi:hypothetical protein